MVLGRCCSWPGAWHEPRSRDSARAVAVQQAPPTRDRYDVTTDEPVPARQADGAQEAARTDAYDAYRHLRQEQPADEPADGADNDRARRRTATATRVGELLDQVRRTQRTPANETLAERARRLAGQRQSPHARPDEPTRGPDHSGPEM